MASKLKDDCVDSDICYICHLQVPSASKTRHEGSYLHQAALRVASTALERLRAHVAPMSKSVPDVEPSEDKEDKDTTIHFCGACAAPIPYAERARHARSKTHLMAALDDQVFDELVRGYVGEEELRFLETVSRDPCDDEENGLVVEKSEATETYTCQMCALEIPKAFKEEHVLSSRHRGCLALANAASRRTIAFLTPTPISVDAPSKKHKENMIALLKAYIGVDIMKLELTETNETEVEDKDTPKAEAKERLTSREYFTEIMPFLQYTGSFNTLIIDDTEFVTIKTENDKYLRVHVANFNGLYSFGESEEYQMKCRMCDGYNFNVSYSSKGDWDRLHVMSLGHIKRVLTPVENIHGIRKIDSAHSLCVLCNALLPTQSVDDHTMKDIHHTRYLAEALERGRLFKESENDMNILIYASPPVDPRGFFMRHPPHNFNSVLPHQSGIFGHGGPFGQNTTFGQNSVYASSTGFGATQPSSTHNTGFGQTGSPSLFGAAPSGLNTTAFGQTATAPAFGATQLSNTHNTGFGQTAIAPAFGATQPSSTHNTGFGQTAIAPAFGATQPSSTHNTGFGQSASATSVDGAKPSCTHNTGFGQIANASAFGTTQPSSTHNTGFGQSASATSVGGAKPSSTHNTGFGQIANASAFGATQPSSTHNTGFGQSASATSVGGAKSSSTHNTGFGQIANASAFGATQPSSTHNTGFGQSASATSVGGAKSSSTHNTGFGQIANASAFGATQPSSTHNTGFGQSASATSVGEAKPSSTHNTGFGQIDIAPAFGATQPSSTHNTGFGQKASAAGFGQPTSATCFGQPTSATCFGQPASATGFGAPNQPPNS